MITSRIVAAAALAIAAGVSCRSVALPQHPAIVQPGAPGQASRVIDAAQAADLSAVRHTPADVQFMQDMIGHHAQALEMSALVASRTANDDVRKLAQRIEISQADEIRMMREWLQARGAPVPGAHAHHAGGAALMPGMLTAAEMERLAAAKGPEFDRLFLAGMIRHHEGAITMVEELFATPGAGQEPDLFAFASDVDADQRMEIDRMGAMLAQLKERQR